MTPQRSSRLERVPRRSLGCSCSSSFLTFAIGAAQLIICSVICFMVLNSRRQMSSRWFTEYDDNSPAFKGKRIVFEREDVVFLPTESSPEEQTADPVLKQIFDRLRYSLSDAVLFPITSLTLKSYSFYLRYRAFHANGDRSQDAMDSYFIKFSISGIILGILLIAGVISKNPKLLGYWLIVDGIRSLTSILPLMYRVLQELWCISGFTSPISCFTPLEPLLMVIAYMAYQIGAFIFVGIKMYDLRKRNRELLTL